MQHTIPITINSLSSIQTNDWENLNTLVQAALVAANIPPVNTFGQRVTILHHRSSAGYRLLITSDPSNTLASKELLVEEDESFDDQMRQASILDKWIKVVDNADVSVDGGKAVITIDCA